MPWTGSESDSTCSLNLLSEYLNINSKQWVNHDACFILYLFWSCTVDCKIHVMSWNCCLTLLVGEHSRIQEIVILILIYLHKFDNTSKLFLPNDQSLILPYYGDKSSFSATVGVIFFCCTSRTNNAINSLQTVKY